jgi:hypothetical protein
MRGTRAGAPRPLSERELELIEALLGGAGAGAVRYLGQLEGARVVGGCGCGCPSIDLEVEGGGAEGAVSPLLTADGESPEGEPVGVILWVRGGFLSGLEVHPWNGSVSIRLPDPAALTAIRRARR